MHKNPKMKKRKEKEEERKEGSTINSLVFWQSFHILLQGSVMAKHLAKTAPEVPGISGLWATFPLFIRVNILDCVIYHIAT